MRRRRARSAVAIAAGAAVLATVPLFIHHAPAPRDVRAMRGGQASYASIERQLSRTTLPEPEHWPWQRASARARMISDDDGGGIGA